MMSSHFPNPPWPGMQSARHSFYGWPAQQATAPPSNTTASNPQVVPARLVSAPVPGPRQRHSMIAPVANAPSLVAKSASSTPSTVAPRAQLNNILFEVEYQQEIFDYMRVMEKQSMPNIELMNVQPELHWYMRPYLVDFLIEIHQSFRLRPETLYLTMNLVDRYVSKRIVYKRHYQLVGCAALLIAAKFEDSKDRVPTVQELCQMCCNAYDPSAFTQMEGHVLSTLGWSLGHPTAETWLRYEYSCAPPANASTHSVARFLLELTLFHERFVPMLPSALAAGAMLLARHICRDPRPLPHPLGAAATNAAAMIRQYADEHLNDLSMILVKKYSFSYYAEASTLAVDWLRRRAEQKQAMAQSPSGYRMDVQSSDEEVDSNPSSDSTHSLFSTPSRSMARDEDEDDSLPLTPMSQHSVQDPTPSHNMGPMHQPRFTHSTPATGRMGALAADVKSAPTPSWMNLSQLRPVARHKSTSVDVDATMESKHA